MYTTDQTQAILQAIKDRRSTKALGPATPSDDELTAIFTAAMSVPDHHQKHPFRFIVLRQPAVQRLAHTAGVIMNMSNPANHKYANKANMAIAVVFCHKKETATPKWEQFVAASGAAHQVSLGLWASNWASHWVSMKDQNNKSLRRFHALTKGEKLLGWIFVGNYKNPDDMTAKVKRPDMRYHVTYLS